MKLLSLAALRLTLILTSSLTTFASAQAPAIKPAADYGKLPLSFETNQGQTDPSVQFLAHGQGYTLYLRQGEAVLALERTASAGPETQPSSLVRMALVNSNPGAAVSSEDQQITKTNYLLGNDPRQWRTGIPNYSRVRYQSIYDGIDLVYYGRQRQLEHDFIVAPNADPSHIVLSLTGAEKPAIDPTLDPATGDLVLPSDPSVSRATPALRLLRPVTYQEIAGRRVPVASAYKLLGKNQVGFTVGRYDHTRPLVIDPVLVYSTYLGGESAQIAGQGAAVLAGDQGNAIAVDKAGSAYITGTTQSYYFPLTPGNIYNASGTPPQAAPSAFVSKFTPDGSALIYSTYIDYGNRGATIPYGIALDSANNAYITGITYNPNFLITCNTVGTQYPTTTAGAPTGFVLALTADGTNLVYSTFLGGAGNQSTSAPQGDVPQSIAVSPQGVAYITGYTFSSNFPTTVGAVQRQFTGSATASNAFVTGLNTTGTAYVYSTYLGGSGSGGTGDAANGIAIDAAGDAFVTGSTTSADFPVTSGVVQPALAGASNAFVTELNPAGAVALFSTYLGGSGSDGARAIALDPSGFVYVAGETTSANFPLTEGVVEGASSGLGAYYAINGPGAFVTKLSKDGSALEYSTYLEGQSTSVYGLAVDSAGAAYITGNAPTLAPNTYGEFQTTPDALTNPTGKTAAFLVKLDPTAAFFNYATLLGGSTADGATALALDSAGNVYLTGFTSSSNFPTTTGAFQTALDNPPNALLPTTVTLVSQDFVCSVNYPGYSVQVTVNIDSGTDGPSPTGTVSFNGTFVVGEAAEPVQAVGPGVSTVSVSGNSSDQVAQSASWELDYSGDSMYAPSSLTGTVSGPGNCDSQPYAKSGPITSAAVAPRSAPRSARPANRYSSLVSHRENNKVADASATPVPNAFVSKFSLAGEDNQTTYPAIPANLPTSINVVSADWYPDHPPVLYVHATLNSGAPGPPPTGTLSLLVEDSTGAYPAIVPPLTNWTGLSADTRLVNFTEDPSLGGAALYGEPYELDYSGDAVYQPSTITGYGQVPCPADPGCPFPYAAPGQLHKITLPLGSTAADKTLTPAEALAIRIKFIPPPVAAQPISAQSFPARPALSSNGSCRAPASPTLSFTPASITFPPVDVGNNATNQILTVTNTSSVPATVRSYTIDGEFSNSSEFRLVTKTCGTTLVAGASCTLTLGFTASVAGPVETFLFAADSATGSPQTVQLYAVGSQLATISVSPKTITFPATRLGSSSAPTVLTLTNTSSAYPLAITSFAFTGASASEFSIASKTCAYTLAQNASCTLSIVFKPTTFAPASAAFTANDNALAGPQSVALTGSVTPPPVALAFSPSSLVFDLSYVYVGPPPLGLTLTNTSSLYPISVSSFTFAGPNASEFSIEGKSCGYTLAPGASCDLTIRFLPTSVGTSTATLLSTDSATGSPQSISLAATAYGPSPTLSPAGLTFPSTRTGTTSAAQVLTVANTDTRSPISVSSYKIAGTNAAEFTLISKTCGTTLAPGTSCTLSIALKPTAPGSASASLVVTDSGYTSPQSVPLTGTGN